ncbi:DEAD/DEAH box helicase family protein [Luminiphilus sp.]|nr:DEAD/DEAH box helicase family protein [Luminiphilus sp.]
MQATCPTCNLKKGASLGLRKHQAEFKAHLEAAASSGVRTILGDITPGGGKSLIPQLACNILKSSDIVDKLCWVVPRELLQEQGATDFQSQKGRSLAQHNLSIFEATNDCDPTRGTDGYVTTYQAIAADSAGINAFEFERSRYLLVLDEVHHVQDGGQWHRQLAPLVERAEFLILLTGTLERGDRKPIAFLQYKDAANACA